MAGGVAMKEMEFQTLRARLTETNQRLRAQKNVQDGIEKVLVRAGSGLAFDSYQTRFRRQRARGGRNTELIGEMRDEYGAIVIERVRCW
jgi:hypothetical protein